MNKCPTLNRQFAYETINVFEISDRICDKTGRNMDPYLGCPR